LAHNSPFWYPSNIFWVPWNFLHVMICILVGWWMIHPWGFSTNTKSERSRNRV
jgi:hypothetical protein